MKKISETIDFGDLRGIGNIGYQDVNGNVSASGLTRLTKVLSITIGLLTIISFIYFLIRLVVAGIGIISSGGDKAKVANARKDMTTSLTGLVVVISVIFIARIVSFIFGINILDIAGSIAKIWN